VSIAIIAVILAGLVYTKAEVIAKILLALKGILCNGTRKEPPANR
jgi:hypothetical protein